VVGPPYFFLQQVVLVSSFEQPPQALEFGAVVIGYNRDQSAAQSKVGWRFAILDLVA